MRILWLSNVDLCNTNPSASGTWIYSMYNALKTITDIEICANITNTSNGEPYMKIDGIRNNYYVPNSYMKRDGTPKEDAICYVGDIIQKEKPDLIHIWGTEKGWGLMIPEHYRNSIPCLLEMQGISFFVAEERFYGGINERDIKKMRGAVELLYPNNRIESVKKRFQQWGEIEKRMIQSFDYVNTQSDWVRKLIFWVAPSIMVFKTGIILRDSFVKAPVWSTSHRRKITPILFTTTSPIPYKGLHDTLTSFSLVLREFPTARLRIAGVKLHKTSWKDAGYIHFLRKECIRMNIANNVDFLGRLDENGLLNEMYNADVFITSTYVESYCLALAEALCIGMPCVAPFTSAITELIENGVNGLLYPQGDFYICAHLTVELLKNTEYSKNLGNKAACVQRKKSAPDFLAKNQANIYKRLSDLYKS